MSRDDELITMKAVLEELGVSRVTLWRALRCDIPEFPQPLQRRRRVYWKRSQLPALETGLDAYQGRYAFDRKKKREQQREQSRYEALSKHKSTKRPRSKPKTLSGQPDLFER